jgi:hypothetical protein
MPCFMINSKVHFCTGLCHPYLTFFWCNRQWRHIRTVLKKSPWEIQHVGFCQFRDNFLRPPCGIHWLGRSSSTLDFTSLWKCGGTPYYWWTRFWMSLWICGINWPCPYLDRQFPSLTILEIMISSLSYPRSKNKADFLIPTYETSSHLHRPTWSQHCHH